MDKERIRGLLMLFPLIIVVAAFFGGLYVLFFATDFNTSNTSLFIERIADGLSILALFSAFVYIVSGYRKSSAKYFKLFLYVYAVSYLSLVIDMLVSFIKTAQSGIPITTQNLLYNGLNIVAFVLINVLLIKENLGKTRSLIMSYLILLINLVFFVAFIMQGVSTQIIVRKYSGLALSIVLVTMEHLKYYDKKQRNTK